VGLIRRLVSDAIGQDRAEEDALDRLAGIGEGDGAPAGREHDRLLYGGQR
jgi:hypothetical protein